MDLNNLDYTAVTTWVTTYKDIYCERTSQNIFAEPLNLFSSLFFLWPAWMAFKAKETKLFGYMFLAVAVGSSLFHSHSTNLTYLLDVACIIATIVVYYVQFFVRVGIKPTVAWFGMLSYLGFLFVSLQALPIEYSYYGVLPLMGGQFAMLFARHQKLDYLRCLAGTGFFCLALVARFADEVACSFMPCGTHFLWHIFNSLVLVALLPLLKKPNP